MTGKASEKSGCRYQKMECHVHGSTNGEQMIKEIRWKQRTEMLRGREGEGRN